MYSERMIIKTTANTDILFDPQTSGPLLATVPKEKSKGCYCIGEKLGFECKLIGELQMGSPILKFYRVSILLFTVFNIYRPLNLALFGICPLFLG